MLHKLEWLVEHLVATLSLNYCKVHSGRLQVHSGRLQVNSGRLQVYSGRFLYLCLFSLIFLARLSTRFDNETA